MGMPAKFPREYNYFETSAKTFSIPARKMSSLRKTLLTMIQFVKMPLQWTQTLHSLDRILKIHSGIINSRSDELENSETVNQS